MQSNRKLATAVVFIGILACKQSGKGDTPPTKPSMPAAEHPAPAEAKTASTLHLEDGGNAAAKNALPAQEAKTLPLQEQRSSPHPLRQLYLGQDGTKETLSALLPGYDVVSEETAIEEGMRPITEISFHADKKRMALARVENGAIFAIRIFDPRFALDAGALAPSQRFESVELLDACGCQGEDGMDGFICSLKSETYALNFETKDNDCSLLTSNEVAAAVKGREIIAVEISASGQIDDR